MNQWVNSIINYIINFFNFRYLYFCMISHLNLSKLGLIPIIDRDSVLTRPMYE